jgi:hypothetical protein
MYTKLVNLRSGSERNVFSLPIMSTFLSVSTMGSMTSSGMCFSLLFCKFNVSSELRFSKASEGIVLMLKES